MRSFDKERPILYLAPYERGGLETISELISEANDFIYIISPLFCNEILADRLVKKKSVDSKIAVRLVTYPIEAYGKKLKDSAEKVRKSFCDAEIDVGEFRRNWGNPRLFSQASLGDLGTWWGLHGKLMVTDKAALFFSSLLRDPLDRRTDIYVIFKDDDHIDHYCKLFENMSEVCDRLREISGDKKVVWDDEIDFSEQFHSKASNFDLYITGFPWIDSGREILWKILSNSRSSIYGIHEIIGDDSKRYNLVDLLIEHKKKGLDIQFIIAPFHTIQKENYKNSIRDMCGNGILTYEHAVKKKFATVHSKVIIVDDHTAVLSSFKLTGSGIDEGKGKSNNEIVEISNDEYLVTELKRRFTFLRQHEGTTALNQKLLNQFTKELANRPLWQRFVQTAS